MTGIVLPTEQEIADVLPVPKTGRSKSRLSAALPKVSQDSIPEALTWRILVLPPAVPEKTESGIHLVTNTVSGMKAMRRVGCVVAKGPLAFSQARGFPDGYDPVEVGDWVGFHENAGIDLWVNGEDGNLVLIKALSEGDLVTKLKNPENFMVVL